MDLNYSDDHNALRAEVRGFIEQFGHLSPASGGGRTRPNQNDLDWQKRLIENGFFARDIPTRFGGFGATTDVLAQAIISEEFSRAGVSPGIMNQGISMLVPTLLEIGTAEQCAEYIRPTIFGEMIWCQGYSEPGAGSDLTSLQTKAHVENGHFVINGQKIWTSSAHYADMMFVLVRTEPEAPKHKGISYLLLSMETPGIEVRPLMTMTGSASFNEVFFTDVKVPEHQIVMGRGDGWHVANVTLKHERQLLGNPHKMMHRLHHIRRMMEETKIGNERLIDRPEWRDRWLKLQGECLASKYHGMRLLSDQANDIDSGLGRLIVKYFGTVLAHKLSALAVDVLGAAGLPFDPQAEDGVNDEATAWQIDYMYDIGPDHRRRFVADPEKHHQRTRPRHAAGAEGRSAAGTRVRIMYFGLSEEQTLIAQSLKGFLDDAYDLDVRRARAAAPGDFDALAWQAFVDQGMTGLLVPDDYGGSNLGGLDAAVVAEAMAYAAAPIAYFSAVLLAPMALREHGSAAQQASYLPGVAGGEIRFASCFTSIDGSIGEAELSLRDGAGRASGLLDPVGATHLLLVGEEGIGVCSLGDPGLGLEIRASLDPLRPLASVELKGVEVDVLIDDGAAARRLLYFARAMLAAEIGATCQAMIDQALAYTAERFQFNRPVASFQAVKHMCAEMAAALEPSKALIWYAAHAQTDDPDEAALLACQAKAHLSEIGRDIARTATEAPWRHGFHRLAGPAFLVQADQPEPAIARRPGGLPRRRRALAGDDRLNFFVSIEDDREPILAQALSRLHIVARIGWRGRAGPGDITGIVTDQPQRKGTPARRAVIAAGTVQN